MQDSIPISATVLAKNSAGRIAACLTSLAAFPQVVVLDNGSTDSTVEIAKSFSNVTVHTSEFIGFGALKNLAASLAANDWIFSIDSDEVASAELISNILDLRLALDQVGVVHRRNHYNGRLINGCGWQNDRVARIYNKRHAEFTNTLVHESLKGGGGKVLVRGDLNHFPFDDPEHLRQKGEFYSSLYARENRFRNRSSRGKALLKGATTFVRDYVLKRGVFYGRDGWLIATANAKGAFYKYSKLHEENQKLSTSLIVTTYNREDALELVLLSVLKQSQLPGEVIIADDGSASQTRHLIEKYQSDFPVPLIHCWQPDEGFRLAQIRNKAIANAAGEYIILVDGDMILHHDFVSGHRSFARNDQFIQGSRVWLSTTDADSLIKEKEIDQLPSFFRRGIGSVSSTVLSSVFSRTTTAIEGVKGCNMSFWKDDCVRVNGFNEDFQSWGREDSEFVARLMNSGVARRNLRFAGVAYHLSHAEAERNDLELNDRILETTISKKLRYCENGLVKKS